MIILNEATYGEKTYIVAISTGTAWLSKYQVAAYSESEAVDKVADHLESEGAKGFYYDYLDLEVMAGCTEYETAEAFAEASGLVCCGNHGIYIELVSVEEVII